MKRILPLVFLAACGAGPQEETLLSELRVIAVVAEPPEVAPGEATTLTLTVADPLAAGADVVVWTCAPIGGVCLEATAHDLTDQVALASLQDQQVQVTLRPSALLAGALAEAPDGVPLPLWILACEPGLCPLVGRVSAALRAGGPAPEDLAVDLADPRAWIADLPAEGVSLAVRALTVSSRPPEARNRNPVIDDVAYLATPTAPESALDLQVRATDDGDALSALPFATSGGFGDPAVPLIEGDATLTWFAPAEAGEAELFVVVEDGVGGAAVWRGAVTVAE